MPIGSGLRKKSAVTRPIGLIPAPPGPAPARGVLVHLPAPAFQPLEGEPAQQPQGRREARALGRRQRAGRNDAQGHLPAGPDRARDAQVEHIAEARLQPAGSPGRPPGGG